ncbi:hypothetical protein BD779DRAFT_1039001 [Infundibulicybe gibba]|nr:hypothetical protein BD779DRAFT_1039001 [Infundibulicybe gibba]
MSRLHKLPGSCGFSLRVVHLIFDMKQVQSLEENKQLVDVAERFKSKAPSPQQYSSATTPNIKALDEEQRILEDAMEVIRFRYTMEHLASEDALKALRGHFGREEHTVVRSITTIRRHHNLLVPVMRLPPEILSRIFVFHAQMEPSWLNGALTSTHVCTRWWETGRACPDLVTHQLRRLSLCEADGMDDQTFRCSPAFPRLNDQAKWALQE